MEGNNIETKIKTGSRERSRLKGSQDKGVEELEKIKKKRVEGGQDDGR